MAEEVHVFFAGDVPSRTSLSAALRRLGWPFVIKRIEARLSDQSGYLPMTLRGEETGAELSFSTVDDDARQLVPDLNAAMDRIAHLRWGASELEMAAALCLAAALADLTQGLVFEEAGGRSMSAVEAIPWAGQHFAAVKPVSKSLGAREADLRRHLRPLLGLRKDLALVGRALVATPIRHVVRGAFLDRSSDRYEVVIRPYLVLPAHGPYSLTWLQDERVILRTWQEHFHELLIDTLAGLVFDSLDRIGTIADFAREAAHDPHGYTHDSRLAMMAHLLAGELDQAQTMLDSGRSAGWRQQFVDELSGMAERNGSELHAACHAREAESMRMLKLERFWEPTPFPAELPRSDRSRSREPAFPVYPWPARPKGILVEQPGAAGEMTFCREVQHRRAQFVAVQPLSLAEATAAWADRRPYACLCRLAEDALLIVTWITSAGDPRDPTPWRRREATAVRCYFDIRFDGQRLFACWSNSCDEPDVLRFDGATTYLSGLHLDYYAYNDFRGRTIDLRHAGERDLRPMDEGDYAALRVARPRPGDYGGLIQSLIGFLKRAGWPIPLDRLLAPIMSPPTEDSASRS
jgi:hypothetical protein